LAVGGVRRFPLSCTRGKGKGAIVLFSVKNSLGLANLEGGAFPFSRYNYKDCMGIKDL